jgi:hypothetical protein
VNGRLVRIPAVPCPSERRIRVAYTTHDGGEWHVAFISAFEYRPSFYTGRLGALGIAAIRVVGSNLIYDHVLRRAGYPHPWRIGSCLTNAARVVPLPFEPLSKFSSREPEPLWEHTGPSRTSPPWSVRSAP